MILKLTYYGKNSPTLVNFDGVETIYEVYDRKMRRVNTKVLYRGGNYVNVEEDLQTILKLSQEYDAGIYQPTDWASTTVDKFMEDSYDNANYERKESRFNRADTFNQNRHELNFNRF